MTTGRAPESDPEVELMLAFCKGREDAFVELYRAYRDRIVSFTRRMLGSDALAEEAAQDVFLKLYRTRESYDPRSRFATFLYRIAVNHCLNLRARVERKHLARGVDPEARPGRSGDGPERALEQRELREELLHALSTLPERQRGALVLVHCEGLSYEAAAEALDVSESAIKSLIHRARHTLIAELEPSIAQWIEVRRAV
jgi:RNA polymerase sigma-70 factor (ECF subfamily)